MLTNDTKGLPGALKGDANGVCVYVTTVCNEEMDVAAGS